MSPKSLEKLGSKKDDFSEEQKETLEKIKELNLSSGDNIINLKTGTVRIIREKVEDHNSPGGGYFRVNTRKNGETKEDILPFTKLLDFEGQLRIERLKEISRIFNESGDILLEPGDIVISFKGARSIVKSIDHIKETVIISTKMKDGSSKDSEKTFSELRNAENKGLISKIQKEDTEF